jgi:hypothetical protein
MGKKVLLVVRACVILAVTVVIGSFVDPAQAKDPRVEFELTDEPGAWFRLKDSGGSLAVVTPGTEVRFTGKSNTVHTRTSLIFPVTNVNPTTGIGNPAVNMPFDTAPRKGSDKVVLRTPGLYVFTCKIHPYMFGAVIVNDPTTDGLDLSDYVTLVHLQVPNTTTWNALPTTSNLAARLLRTFFIATNPSNWLDYRVPGPYHISYPGEDPNNPVYVLATGGARVNLHTYLSAVVGIENDAAKASLFNPAPGKEAVGEIWVDTQFEKTASKSKPGTATAIDGTTWQIKRKVALPEINMNNPHNMWTDRNQNLIYQTQWFDSKLAVFDRETGRYINNIEVGESPSHVMTRVDTDQLHVALNGSPNNDSVVELAPLANGVQGRINIGRGNPHAHWMSHDGHTMVTPNAFSADSTQYDFLTNIPTIRQAGNLPIATGMTPDSSKYYVANLLDSSITVISTTNGPIGSIDLIKGYNAVNGNITGTEFGGALPIQTPVAPDGKSMVTANTLTGTIAIVDTRHLVNNLPNPNEDKVVAMLPCDPGCHGVQYGAKQGGGYYAYVSSKFSNALIVVDPDINGDGDPKDADIVGRILLAGPAASDDAVTGLAGMGGQGILTIPVVYNGWVQNLPQNWACKLSGPQLNPIGAAVAPPTCP